MSKATFSILSNIFKHYHGKGFLWCEKGLGDPPNTQEIGSSHKLPYPSSKGTVFPILMQFFVILAKMPPPLIRDPKRKMLKGITGFSK